MKHGLFFFLALAVAATGCGNSTPSAENPGSGEHGSGEHGHGEHGERGEEHAKLTGPIAEFHEILAPIWHSPEGSERLTKACEKASAMHDKAVAVEAAPAPEGAKADDYKAAAKALTAEVDRMSAECKKETIAGVDLYLKTVHEAFHKVAEMPMPPGGHGEDHKH